MHRLVPTFIQKKFLAGEQSGSFSAAALFVDVSGFTRITDVLMGHSREGSEALANIINDIFEPLMHSVFEQGGFVTNLAGDAFTALFPLEHGDSDGPNHALSAAWRIQQIMASHPEHETRYDTFPVSVKVGVSIGSVSWRILSSEDDRRSVYIFQGAAIDGCAAAQRRAQAGQVILDADMLAAITLPVEVEEADDHFRLTRIDGPLAKPHTYTLDAVDPEVALRFYPQEALQPSSTGEFRQVVSMFIRLLDVPSADQLQGVVQRIFALQDRYGGLLNRVEFGDNGAMVVLFWGAPIAHENDLVRSLSFVLDLQDTVGFSVQAGIAAGIAHAGFSGSALAGEYTCHGRGPTLAARLMQSAPQRAIWIDESVAQPANDHFQIELRGEKAFKGFEAFRRVFALVDRKTASRQLYANAMIGRQRERQILLEFCQPIWNGQYAGVLVVEGESGIGKSRLVSDILQDPNLQSHSAYICQADEILRESLNPFRYWLRGYFDQSEQRSIEQNRHNFDHRIDRLSGAISDENLIAELARTRSFLGALVDLYWPDSLYEQLDAQGRYENTLTGLITLLEAESLRQPVLLLLEDGHWLDPDSQAVLRQLTQILKFHARYPIAVLITARPGGDLSVTDQDLVDRVLKLGQLPLDDLGTLAEKQLGNQLEVNLLEKLVEQADGNPFFAEQILRYLREQELVELVDGKWIPRLDQDEFVLPTDIHSVLAARLDQLDPEVKTVVQTAAVLGREFEIPVLSGMVPDELHLTEKVEKAERRSIWMEQAGRRYLFKHMMLRDTAYHMQVSAQRRLLHARAADTLESLYAKNLQPHYGEVAYHAHLAGMTEKAHAYFVRAGEHAKEGFHNRQAVEYYTRALELTSKDDVEEYYQLLRERERLLDLMGERTEQKKDIEALTDLLAQIDDPLKKIAVAIRQAWWSMWNGDYPQSIEYAQKALDKLDVHPDLSLRTQALYISSWTLMQQGLHPEARIRAEMALETARSEEDLNGVGNALNVLALIWLAVGDYYHARQNLESFLQNSRKINNRERETAALGNLGVVSTLLGQYTAARAYHEQALPIAREIGHRNYIATEQINMSWVAGSQGLWEEAIELGEASIGIVQESGMLEGEAEALIWMGHAWSGLGEAEKAMAAYERSLEIRRQIGQSHLAMGVLAGMARLAMTQNDAKRAEAYVSEIVAYLDDEGTLDGTWEPLRIYLTCYQVLAAVGNVRGVEFLRTAHKQLHDRESKIPDVEFRRVFMEEVPWNRAIEAAYTSIQRS